MADGWPRLVQNFDVNKIPASDSSPELRDYFRDVHFNRFTMFGGDVGKQRISFNIKDMRNVRIKGPFGSQHKGSTGKLLKFDEKSRRWLIKLPETDAKSEKGANPEKTITVRPHDFEVVQSDELLTFGDGTPVEVVLGHNFCVPDPVSLFHFYHNLLEASLDEVADVSDAREPRKGDKVVVQRPPCYNGKKGKLVELLTRGRSRGRWKVELDEWNAGGNRYLHVEPEDFSHV
jgi:hypothetical protein